MESKYCSVSAGTFSEQSEQERLKELIELQRVRKENDKQFKKLSKSEKIVYLIAKGIAESDSIGEGYNYHNKDYLVGEFKDKACEYRAVAQMIYWRIKRV